MKENKIKPSAGRSLVRGPRGTAFAALTAAQAEDGSRLCISTAKRLIRAGRSLARSKFLDLAVVSICTAIEEVGKAFMLLDFQEKKFTGQDDAWERVSESFYQHPNKLEIALAYWKRDEMFLKTLSGYKPSSESIQDISKELLGKIDSVVLPDLGPLAKAIFAKRNKLLYTNFEDGNFLPPQGQVTQHEFRDLLDIAEKGAARAELEWVLTWIFHSRGISRNQVSELVRDHLPELLVQIQAKLKDAADKRQGQ